MNKLLSAGALMLTLGAGPANAALILFEGAFNVDGAVTTLTTPEGAAIDTALNAGTQVSTSFSFTTVGLHNVLAYFDFEIDELENTFFNEEGATGGAVAGGQSFEIDEPGFAFGDIYDNFTAGALDNTNGLAGEEDVSMAMGFDFVLAATETAVVTFFLDVVNNSAGAFFLQHLDANSLGNVEAVGPGQVFFWSTLTITGGEEPPPTGVPEPGTLALLAAALLPLALRRRSIRLAGG